MSKISNYEADAKQELYDAAQKIAAMHDQFVDDDRLMDDAAFRKIAPSLDHLDRLLTTYNGLCGACSDSTASHHSLSYSDLFSADLADEFRHYREDHGIIVEGEDAKSLPSSSDRRPIQSDKHWTTQEFNLDGNPTKPAWKVTCEFFDHIQKAFFPKDIYPGQK